MSSDFLNPLFPSTIRKGRPPKSDSLTSAERARRSRDKRKAEGLSEVKCYLTEGSKSYLAAICAIHQCTISDAVSMMLEAAVREGLMAQATSL
jgi:uncharacterized membrane protein